MVELAQGFVNQEAIKAFGVATVVVVAVAAVFRRVLGIHHAAVPFLTALLISVGLTMNEGTPNFWGWVFAFFNACLLFCAAIGANESAVDLKTKKMIGSGKQQGTEARTWFKSYFRPTK